LYEFIDGTGIDLEQWAVPDLPDLDLDSWLDKFMRDPAALGDPEAVPEEPTTQRGNLWVLGDHRVLCGDATSVDDVEKLMDGEVATLMMTDPPYGVEYDPEWRKEAGVNKNDAKMGEVQNDDRADWSEAWSISPSVVAYVWHAGRYASVVQSSLEQCDFDIRNQIIWVKDRFALSRGH